jgi:alpha-glucuronidase
VVLGTNSNPTEKRLTEILAECFKDRAGINLAEEAEKAPLRLIIGTTESNEKIKDFASNHKEVAELGADGYMIAFEAEKSELYIAGQSNSGVVAGLGRLMREMRFEQGKVVVPTLQISETPQMRIAPSRMTPGRA